jgi:hypothetical protein
MTFGGVNHSQYIDELINFPLKTKTWWALDFKELAYGDDLLVSYSPRDNAIGVVDTGTSLAAFPQDTFDKLSIKWSKEFGAKEMVCQSGVCFSNMDCIKTAKKMSPLSITLGTK